MQDTSTENKAKLSSLANVFQLVLQRPVTAVQTWGKGPERVFCVPESPKFL